MDQCNNIVFTQMHCLENVLCMDVQTCTLFSIGIVVCSFYYYSCTACHINMETCFIHMQKVVCGSTIGIFIINLFFITDRCTATFEYCTQCKWHYLMLNVWVFSNDHAVNVLFALDIIAAVSFLKYHHVRIA